MRTPGPTRTIGALSGAGPTLTPVPMRTVDPPSDPTLSDGQKLSELMFQLLDATLLLLASIKQLRSKLLQQRGIVRQRSGVRAHAS